MPIAYSVAVSSSKRTNKNEFIKMQRKQAAASRVNHSHWIRNAGNCKSKSRAQNKLKLKMRIADSQSAIFQCLCWQTEHHSHCVTIKSGREKKLPERNERARSSYVHRSFCWSKQWSFCCSHYSLNCLIVLINNFSYSAKHSRILCVWIRMKSFRSIKIISGKL